MIQIQVRLFGAFRKVGDGSLIELESSEPMAVEKLREVFAAKIQEIQPGFDTSLVKESAFATEDVVLDDSSVIDRDSRLAILPPVCGG